MPMPEPDELYTSYRAYIVHEDNLINQRTTWSTTIQGFMITAFGLVYSPRLQNLVGVAAPSQAPANDSVAMGEYPARAFGNGIELRNVIAHQTADLLHGIAALGIAVAVTSLAALTAAVLAIASVSGRYRHLLAANPGLAADLARYPWLTGGGSFWAHALGNAYPLMLPTLFILFWVWVALVAV